MYNPSVLAFLFCAAILYALRHKKKQRSRSPLYRYLSLVLSLVEWPWIVSAWMLIGCHDKNFGNPGMAI